MVRKSRICLHAILLVLQPLFLSVINSTITNWSPQAHHSWDRWCKQRPLGLHAILMTEQQIARGWLSPRKPPSGLRRPDSMPLTRSLMLPLVFPEISCTCSAPQTCSGSWSQDSTPMSPGSKVLLRAWWTMDWLSLAQADQPYLMARPGSSSSGRSPPASLDEPTFPRCSLDWPKCYTGSASSRFPSTSWNGLKARRWRRLLVVVCPFFNQL